MGWKDPGHEQNPGKSWRLLHGTDEGDAKPDSGVVLWLEPGKSKTERVQVREVGHEMARSEAPVEGHESALRAVKRRMQVRKVSHGGVTYASVSAHDLLEHEDYSHRARPGHPLG